MTENRSLPAIADDSLPRSRSRRSSSRSARRKPRSLADAWWTLPIRKWGSRSSRCSTRPASRSIFPEGQTCCGAPARYSGAYEVAAQNGADNIRALLAEDVKYVVSACPTCTVALKQDFSANLEAVGRTRGVARRARPCGKGCGLLNACQPAGRAGPAASSSRAIEPTRFTYHDSCHFKRTLRADQTPRKLMKQAGYELGGDGRERHVLRHGRLLYSQAAGDFRADPATQAGEYRESRRPAVAHRLPWLRHADSRRSRSSAVPRSRWSIPRSALSVASNSEMRIAARNWGSTGQKPARRTDLRIPKSIEVYS